MTLDTTAAREAAERTIALRDAATKGPWEICGHPDHECQCGIVFGDGGNVYVHCPPNVNEVDPVPIDELKANDSRLIKHARNSDLPELLIAALDEIERLRAWKEQALREVAINKIITSGD